MALERAAAQEDDALHARIVSSRPLQDRRGHVRAGSALLRYGARLLAVQDDACAAAWVDPDSGTVEPLVLEGPGGPLPKMLKPDLEAACRLPDGRACIFGSGSTPMRRRMVWLEGDPPRARMEEAPRLYDAIGAALGMPPNLEGVVASDDRLLFFHRGPGRAREANFTLELPLAPFLAGRPEVQRIVNWNLGDIGGLHLGFTDACLLNTAGILYLAAAEDTPDGIADGPVAGAAVGVMDGGDTARWTVLRESDGSPSRRKVEGVALDPEGAGAWLLTDPDDPGIPAELCRVELRGFV